METKTILTYGKVSVDKKVYFVIALLCNFLWQVTDSSESDSEGDYCDMSSNQEKEDGIVETHLDSGTMALLDAIDEKVVMIWDTVSKGMLKVLAPSVVKEGPKVIVRTTLQYRDRVEESSGFKTHIQMLTESVSSESRP